MKKFIWHICKNITPKVIKNNILLINNEVQIKFKTIKNHKEIIKILLDNLSKEDNSFTLLMDNFHRLEDYIKENLDLNKEFLIVNQYVSIYKRKNEEK